MVILTEPKEFELCILKGILKKRLRKWSQQPLCDLSEQTIQQRRLLSRAYGGRLFWRGEGFPGEPMEKGIIIIPCCRMQWSGSRARPAKRIGTDKTAFFLRKSPYNI